MNRLSRTLKIISTNWVHLVGFYVTTYFSLILFNFLGLEGYTTETCAQTLFLNLIMILYLIFGYGLMFLIGLFGALIIMDSIAFNVTKNRIKLILFLEWLLIIPPFINWAFEYEYWLWFSLSISFFITQLFREKKIAKIINRNLATSAYANEL